MSSSLDCLFAGLMTSPVPALALDLSGHPLQANPALLDLLGHTHVSDLPAQILLYGDQGRIIEHAISGIVAQITEHYSLPHCHLTSARGSVIDFTLHLSALSDFAGKPFALLGVLIDETEHNLMEMERRKLFNAVENSGSAVVITTAAGGIEYVNQRFTDITGYALHEIIHKQPSFLKSGNTPREVYNELWDSIRHRKRWRGSLQNRRKDGTLYWCFQSISPILDEDGELTHIVSVSDDITHLKEHQRQMEKLAYYDPLTELGNRRRFREALDTALHQPHDGLQALLLLDLDHFKKINDTMGHEAGDRLLRTIASRLLFCVGDKHAVFRLGGDEFTIILSGLSHLDEIKRCAQDIISLLSQPVNLGTHQLQVTVSIGIALLCKDSGDVSSLLRNADLAMYQAKHEGRNTFQFYNEDMNRIARRALTLEHDLRQALNKGYLRLHYQPKIDMHNRRMVGMEALLRWYHPDEGVISPVEFIPMAEETGLITLIGRWVIQQALADTRRLLDQHPDPHFRVAINISARQFEDRAFPTQIEEALRLSGVPPTAVELEITESVMLENFNYAQEVVHRLRKTGITIAIDDFGTGYSSLSYLKRMPLDVLKIDRSFVQDIPEDQDDLAITSTIIVMAQLMNLSVIAEGVETEEQERFLLEKGCSYAQGYFYSRAIPLDELIRDFCTDFNYSLPPAER